MPTYDSWQNYLFITFLVVSLLNRPIVFYYYWIRYRKSPVIRTRLPHVCLVLFLANWISEIAAFVPFNGRDACLASLLLVQLLQLVTSVIPGLRVVWLHLNWKLTRGKILQGRHGHKGAIVTRSWLLLHPYIVTKTFFGLVLFAATLLSAIFVMWQWFTFAQYNPGVCVSQSLSTLGILLSFAGMFVLGTFVFLLRRANDAYHILRELQLDFAVWIVSVSLSTVALVVFTSFSTTVFPLKSLVVSVTYEVYLFTAFVKPIMWARDFDRTGVGSSGLVTLESVLRSDDGRAAFTEYLKTEFAVEGIEFYVAVREYEALFHRKGRRRAAGGATPPVKTQTVSSDDSSDHVVLLETTVIHDDRLQVAKAVYNTFIKEGALMQVNLSWSVRHAYDELFATDADADVIHVETKDAASPIDANLFRPAWLEVEQVLAAGPFSRFLKTPAGSALVVQVGAAPGAPH
ncbi:RGS domain-containing protein [Plasmodiophora brassicae]